MHSLHDLNNVEEWYIHVFMLTRRPCEVFLVCFVTTRWHWWCPPFAVWVIQVPLVLLSPTQLQALAMKFGFDVTVTVTLTREENISQFFDDRSFWRNILYIFYPISSDLFFIFLAKYLVHFLSNFQWFIFYLFGEISCTFFIQFPVIYFLSTIFSVILDVFKNDNHCVLKLISFQTPIVYFTLVEFDFPYVYFLGSVW